MPNNYYYLFKCLPVACISYICIFNLLEFEKYNCIIKVYKYGEGEEKLISMGGL